MNKKALKRIAAAALTAALAAFPLAALAKGRLGLSGQVSANAGTVGHAVKDNEIWDGSISTGFAAGSGTQSDPYIITNGAELAYLAQQVNGGDTFEGKYLKLFADIYLNDTANWENWVNGAFPANEWTAIGNKNNVFSGTFDGNGFAVYGMYIDKVGTSDASCHQGLFGRTINATVQNINIHESFVCGYDHVGSIIGDANSTKISGVHNTGNITGRNSIGGVVGYAKSCHIVDCYNESSLINGAAYIGGIVGFHEKDGRIINCHNYGTVSSSDTSVGGICGNISSCTVMNCSNKGIINGKVNVGGIFGYCDDCNVSTCFNSGAITGSSYVAGISGSVDDGTISDCYNTGITNGSGLFGEIDSPSISTCYSIKSGRIIGSIYYWGPPTVSNCYNLDTSCGGSDEYATVLTDSQMRSAASFEGFDFDEIWTMDGNPDYPYPELIGLPHEEIISEVPTPVPTDTPAAPPTNVPTPTPRPSPTSVPTPTPRPSPTSVPTPTPRPSPTSVPTQAPSPTPNLFDLGDVDGDGIITVSDALLILRFVMGLVEL